MRNIDEAGLFGTWSLIGGKSKDVLNYFITERKRSWFVKKDYVLTFSI